MKPAGCPRDRDGGLGPRVCPFARVCPHHNLHELVGRRGRGRPADPAREVEAFELRDDCSFDVAERVRLDELRVRRKARRRHVMSLERIGLHLGMSRQAVAAIAERVMPGEMRARRRRAIIQAWLARKAAK